MKTHYLILALFMLLGISCSSDDETSTPAPEPPIPIESRFLSKITDENDAEVMSFSYNADKTIKTIEAGSGAMQFRYEYENGNISRIYFTIEGQTVFTDFEYTNGILSSYTQEGEIHPVEYDAESNAYSFTLNGYIYQFFFTSNNDIQKIIGELGEEGELEVNLFYEPQFGSLHNNNSITLQTIFASYLNFFFYIQNLNLSSQPLESVISPTQTFNYLNTYDELNGLIQSEITSIADGEANTKIYKYVYVEL